VPPRLAAKNARYSALASSRHTGKHARAWVRV